MLCELDFRKNMRTRVRSNSLLGIKFQSSSLSYTLVFRARSFSTVLDAYQPFDWRLSNRCILNVGFYYKQPFKPPQKPDREGLQSARSGSSARQFFQSPPAGEGLCSHKRKTINALAALGTYGSVNSCVCGFK